MRVVWCVVFFSCWFSTTVNASEVQVVRDNQEVYFSSLNAVQTVLLGCDENAQAISAGTRGGESYALHGVSIDEDSNEARISVRRIATRQDMQTLASRRQVSGRSVYVDVWVMCFK